MAFNPIRSVRRVVSAVALDPDADPDPEWDKPGIIGRATGALTRYPYLTVAAVFMLVAGALFFVPVIPTAHYNGWTLGLGVYVLSVAVAYIQGRKAAFQTLKQYDLNVLFTGRHVVPRLGKRTGDIDDRLTGFKALKKFGSGGLRTAFVQFRDRYGRSEIADHKEKHHRVENDGSGDVVFGLLKTTTFESDRLDHGIDLFNSVSITHAGEEAERLESKDVDAVPTIPPVIDSRISGRVQTAFRSLNQSRKQSEQMNTQLNNFVDRLEEYVDPSGQVLFEDVRELVNEFQPDRRSESSTQSNTQRRNGRQS